jgi:hypothetical protein
MNKKVSQTVNNGLSKVMKKWVSVLKTVNPENEIARNETLMCILPFEMVWLSHDNSLIFQQYGQDPKSLDELNVHELRIAAALADNLADYLQLKDEHDAIDKAASILAEYDMCDHYITDTDLVSALRSVIAEAV